MEMFEPVFRSFEPNLRREFARRSPFVFEIAERERKRKIFSWFRWNLLHLRARRIPLSNVDVFLWAVQVRREFLVFLSEEKKRRKNFVSIFSVRFDLEISDFFLLVFNFLHVGAVRRQEFFEEFAFLRQIFFQLSNLFLSVDVVLGSAVTPVDVRPKIFGRDENVTAMWTLKLNRLFRVDSQPEKNRRVFTAWTICCCGFETTFSFSSSNFLRRFSSFFDSRSSFFSFSISRWWSSDSFDSTDAKIQNTKLIEVFRFQSFLCHFCRFALQVFIIAEFLVDLILTKLKFEIFLQIFVEFFKSFPEFKSVGNSRKLLLIFDLRWTIKWLLSQQFFRRNSI